LLAILLAFPEFVRADEPTDQEVFDSAIAEYRAGLYDVARKSFSELLPEDPGSPFAITVTCWLGECSMKLKDYPAAQRYYDGLAAMRSPGPFYGPRALLYSGVALEELGRGEEAVAAYQKLRAGFPESDLAAEATFRHACVSYRGERFAQAADLFGKILIEYPSSAFVIDSLFFLAESELALGSLPEAIKRYESLLSIYGDSRWARAGSFRLAEIEFRQGDLDGALDGIENLREESPDDAWTGSALRIKGDILFDRGDYEGAMAAYEGAVSILKDGGEREVTSYSLGLARASIGRMEDALGAFKSAGDGEKSVTQRAIIMAALGHEDDARLEFEKLLKLYPNASRSEDALIYLARAYSKAGDDGRAFKAMDTLVRNFTSSRLFPEYLYRRATALLALEMLPEALDDLQRILKDFPFSGYGPEGSYSVGSVYARRGEFSRALPYFEGASASLPGSDLSRRCRLAVASCMFNMGNLGGALAVFETLLAETVDESARGSLVVDIARTLYKMERFEEAVSRFMEASRLPLGASDGAEALYWLGWSLSRLGRLAEAKDAFLLVDRSYPQEPRAAESLLRAAGSALRLSDDETAVSILERAILRAEGVANDVREEALYEKGTALARMGRVRESEGTFEQLAREYPDGRLAAEAFYARAADAMDGRRYAEARLLYGEVNRRFSASPLAEQALYWEGESALSSGDATGAAGIFFTFMASYPRGTFLPSALDGYGRALDQADDITLAEQFLQTARGMSALTPQCAAQIRLEYSKLLLSRDPAEALIVVEEVLLSPMPDDQAREAYLLLGMCHASTGEDAAAREVFKGLIVSRHDRVAAKALFESGRSWEAEGSPAEAFHAFASVYADYPEFPDLASEGLFNAARIAAEIGERGIAVTLEARLKKEYPGSTWIMRLAGERNAR
jgi:TolA-binding protein